MRVLTPMKHAKDNNLSNYSFDLVRMTEAVEGKNSGEALVLKGPMMAAEIQKALERAYALVAQKV